MKKNLFVYPRLEKYRVDPLKCVFCFSFFYFIGLIYYIRAIRTRTVDLLGKTDQTDYYQNDLNCFKDPTCIFFALGSFINWYKYQLVHHIFSWQKDKEMAPCALIHYFDSDPGALPKFFKEGYLDVGLPLA